MPGPATRALVPRPALAGGVRAAVDAHALTILCAPAGCGKTSLLALALSGPECAWYTAQLWQAGAFAEPLVEEVRRLRPGFGRLTLGVAGNRPGGDPSAVEAWAQRLGATFASELGHVARHITIVVEDVALLTGDGAFAGFMVGAMRALPPHARLVLSGRSMPDLPIAQCVAQGEARL